MNNFPITSHLAQIRSITGRDDLVDPVIEYIEGLERVVGSSKEVIDKQDEIIADQAALINIYEKQLSLPFFQRIFAPRMKRAV